MESVECYAVTNRATPLLGKRTCLENHEQYICGTCGRCICCQKDEKRHLRRIDFPFKNLEIAQLYLSVADQLHQKSCGIYELINASGRKSYKLFVSDEEFADYLVKNKQKKTTRSDALYRREEYLAFPKTEMRRLQQHEVETYLSSK